VSRAKRLRRKAVHRFDGKSAFIARNAVLVSPKSPWCTDIFNPNRLNPAQAKTLPAMKRAFRHSPRKNSVERPAVHKTEIAGILRNRTSTCIQETVEQMRRWPF